MTLPGISSRWYHIGSSEDFVEEQPVCRSIGGLEIAIFRFDGELFALDDRCTHGDARLSEGWVDGNCVECPLHQARFNLWTGEPETPPAWEPVKAYRLRVDGADVFIEI